MKSASVKYLTDWLDAQYAHIEVCALTSKRAAERQRLYYNGCITAANIAISEAYSEPVAVFLCLDGRHAVLPARVVCENPNDLPRF